MKTDPDCIFCKVVAGTIPADIVHEGEHVVAFRDINPQAPTHVQVIPRTHVARAEGLEKGFRLVINNGPLSGQSVPHVHLHVLGGRQLGWPPG